MKRAVSNSTAPILFFQAANDQAATKASGKPYALKIYPAYGNSPVDGHTLGYFGSSVWVDDVFQFLRQHCQG